MIASTETLSSTIAVRLIGVEVSLVCWSLTVCFTDCVTFLVVGATFLS
ncbi:MAG: hypothetical protein L0K41_06975 [Yaniella sp.]|nr:hypothetical protein [Yaniella sp.]MDN5732114.1 hypothetical protein [Yaniella sp.]MDN6173428.1 hypothetical protein [Yaniella sp.]MDN6411459.1 hypothetical protein [Yaniella sp.]MDN6457261.1 hypothetical protein [Yaniella sp.]MDN6490130.1 hypothetical protein [Yaniella sp.]